MIRITGVSTTIPPVMPTNATAMKMATETRARRFRSFLPGRRITAPATCTLSEVLLDDIFLDELGFFFASVTAFHHAMARRAAHIGR